MSEVARNTPEKAAVDWRKLADKVFPADALRSAPTVNPLAVVSNP